MNCSKSLKGDVKTTLRIKNQSKSVIKHIWLDYDGKEKPYGPIKPGGEVVQETYVTHPWVFKDETGNVRLVLVIGSKKGVSVTLSEEAGWPKK